jgi:hypothetical protein
VLPWAGTWQEAALVTGTGAALGRLAAIATVLKMPAEQIGVRESAG